jgi:uncharacterized protein YxeA
MKKVFIILAILLVALTSFFSLQDLPIFTDSNNRYYYAGR